MTNTYRILRFFREPGKQAKEIARGLTLEEAKEHCRRRDTRKEGEWFDGYTRE